MDLNVLPGYYTKDFMILSDNDVVYSGIDHFCEASKIVACALTVLTGDDMNSATGSNYHRCIKTFARSEWVNMPIRYFIGVYNNDRADLIFDPSWKLLRLSSVRVCT